MTTDRINFINEDDAWRVFLGILEHVANPCRTDTNKHFDEIRAGNTEKRHLGFTSNRFGQQGFTGTRVAYQQDPLGNTATQFLKL